MVEIKPFKGTRPYNEDAKNLIAPSTDHLSIENIEIFKKNNYWNYLKILNPVGPVSYTHLRAHETLPYLVCRLLLEKNRFF